MHFNGLHKQFFSFVPTLCFFAALAGGAAQAATLSMPSQYATIQSAIDAAVDGDEILVADGTYIGPGNKDLDFAGKAITVRSESGNPAACIIDCEDHGRGFYFHSDETAASVVSGFTVRSGYVYETYPGSYSGGAIHCYYSSPTLTNCVISGNTSTGTSTYGGGLACYYSSPTLTNCTITGNTARGSYGRGGGVYCYYANPALTNCAISGNTAASGGGVCCDPSSNPTLTNCRLSGNTATYGGGVFCSSSSPVLTNCILWGDTPQEIDDSYGTPVVSYCDVQGGYAGMGNINADPGFAFADDFHLASGSPCIDAGTDDPPGGLPARDADGNFRPLDGNNDGQAVADIGTYEFNPATPSIALSTESILFFVPQGQSGQEPKILSIRNAGGGVLHWTLTWDASWLQADAVQGGSAGAINAVSLSADATALAHGSYATMLTISDSQAINSPRVVEVALNVTAMLHVPGEYPTIQAAIDAAVPGDQVVVGDGVYTGTGNKDLDFLGRAITVRSESGNPAACIIDCENSGRGFYFHSGETADAVVEGFTVRHGSASGVYCESRLSPNCNPTLTNCTISANADGGVFCSDGSSPTLTNCAISENLGSGILCMYECSPTLTDCTISMNRGSIGGGLYCYSACSPTLSNCIISANTVSGNTSSPGGGVFCLGSGATLTNCIISGNTASIGGGVYSVYSPSPTLTNCVISGNRANDAGGMYCYFSSPTLTNCILWDDSPQEIDGDEGQSALTYCDVQGGYPGEGNIDVYPNFAFADDFHLVAGSPGIDTGTNSPTGGLPGQDADGNPRPLDGDSDGSAVADMGVHEFDPAAPSIAVSPSRFEVFAYTDAPQPTMRTLSIRGNTGGTLAWQIATGCSWLSADPPSGSCQQEVDAVVLSFNTAGLAAGSYSCTLVVSAPQASNSPRHISVTFRVGAARRVPSDYSTIQAAIDAAAKYDWVLVADGVYAGSGNRDLDFHGKAITLRSESSHAAACIIDCESSGRGFYFHSGETAASVVEGFTIRNGAATSASPGSYYGGGVYCNSSSSPTLTNCTIIGSTASRGGGLYCKNSSNPALTDCTIRGNTVLSSGGGVHSTLSSNPTLINCSISGNTAPDGGGVFCDSSSSLRLISCTLFANIANSGGAVYCYSSSSSILTNCTLSGNTAKNTGGGVYCPSSLSLTLTNCILWGDTPQEIDDSYGTSAVMYCDVQGGYPGTGNISVDPNFAFADDLHLMAGSPCIDTGTNSPAGSLTGQDADGHGRPLDGNGDGSAVADMGAYEFDPAGPVMAVSPARLVFMVQQGQGGQPRTLAIRNRGTETLSWSLNWEASWLQADAVQGESTGEVDTVTFTVNAGTLSHGSYSTTLLVAGAQASNSPRTVEVVLYVAGASLQVPDEYPTIQAAIDAAVPGDQVVVANGVYVGTGNKDLNFLGKDIAVRGQSRDPAACIIDCQGSGRGFYFHTGETAAAVVESVTIRSGLVGTSNPGGARGAGVLCAGSSPRLTNCVISGNMAWDHGAGQERGGGVCCYFADPVMSNCRISDNQTGGPGFGGGVYCYAADLVMTDCTFSRNAADGGGGALYLYSGSPRIMNCEIISNWSGQLGGGVNCTSSDATLSNCIINGNDATYGGGVYCNSSTSPKLIDCSISGNLAAFGGGVCCENNSSPTITGCSISTNIGRNSGGGVFCISSSAPKLTNCTIVRNTVQNSSGSGAAVHCHSSSPLLTNCTITGNTGSSASAGVYCRYSSSPTLANCILWGDTPQEIYLSGSNSPTVFNCDVQGGWSGSGNISVNPAFVDAPHGNYRLSLHSPCIDVGSNAAIPAGVIVDMDGNPRLVDGNCDGAAIADMGAYEFAPPSGDFNCDGSVNVADYWYIHDGIGHCSPEQAYQDHVLADLDHDGCITLADYQSWLTCYRNANGVGFTLPPQDSDASVFINVLLGFDADPAHLVTFDLNGDQTVDGRDIQQFVNALCGP